MNILLTGATGLLGSYVTRLWNNDGILACVYVGSYSVPDSKNIKYFKTDIRNKEGLEGIFKTYKIDVVIHAAGEARVDYCQKHYDDAYSTNVSGTKNVVDLCKKYKARHIYISTNAVFDGTKPLYKESDAPNPINAYGKIKLECETLVRSSLKKFQIIRPILMYGWNRPEERDNIATWLIKKMKRNEEVLLVDDVFDNMLFARQCAECIYKIIDANTQGIYHIGGAEVLSRYEFGLVLAGIIGCDNSLVKSVKNEYFKDIAPRPKNTSYDTGKIRKEFGIEPMNAKNGLSEMMKESDKCQSEIHFLA